MVELGWTIADALQAEAMRPEQLASVLVRFFSWRAPGNNILKLTFHKFLCTL
jgi:hypothetical protein